MEALDYNRHSIVNKNIFPYPALEEMSLQEITKNYLCAKSEGKISNCKKCEAKCIYGLRALALFFGEDNAKQEEDAGPTILERARAAKAAEEGKKKKIKIENWYEKAEASGDMTKWVMENFNLTKTKAKSKIYSYRYDHNLTTKTKAKENTQEPEVKPEPVNEKPTLATDNSSISSIEEKLAQLMKLQDEYKAKAEKYQKLYEEAKRKGDILCNAMDIMNDKEE